MHARHGPRADLATLTQSSHFYRTYANSAMCAIQESMYAIQESTYAIFQPNPAKSQRVFRTCGREVMKCSPPAFEVACCAPIPHGCSLHSWRGCWTLAGSLLLKSLLMSTPTCGRLHSIATLSKRLCVPWRRISCS